MRIRVVLAALLFSLVSQSQEAAPPASDQASVWFNFEWSEGVPWQNYSIRVQSDGKTHFNGTPSPSQVGDTDAVQRDFIMSETNRQKIFDSARRLNYFQGDFDSHLKRIAQTGSKTLAYKSVQVRGSSTYNYSQNPDVQQLTQLFLRVATAIDYGRQLAWSYRYDKLGLDQRLRELEELQAGHQVEELTAIEPMLRKIADDPNLMHISRQSAQHLLKTISASTTASQSEAQP
ncbi:MAG: hypothetical protein ACLPND_07520 [Candidatus Korobacteraceae bacterium]